MLKVGVGVGAPLVGCAAAGSGVGEVLPETSGSTMTGSPEAVGVGAADAAGDAEAGWDATALGVLMLGVLVLEVLALGEDVEVDDVVPVLSDGVGDPAEGEPVAGAGGR